MASKIEPAIIEAAIECFSRSGYHGATTKEISKKADVTEGSLFRLFPTKEILFDKALRFSFSRDCMSPSAFIDLLERDDLFAKDLAKAMLGFFDNLDQRYVRFAAFAMLERPDLARECFLNPSNSLTRAVSRVIEREIYRGKLRKDIDPAIGALELISAVWYLAFAAPILPPEFKVATRAARREAVESFVEIWVRGMEHPSKPKPIARRRK